MRVASLFRTTVIAGIAISAAFFACGPSHNSAVDSGNGGGGGGGAGGGGGGGIDSGGLIDAGSGSGGSDGSAGSGSDGSGGSGSDTGSGSDGSGGGSGSANALGTICTPGTGSNFQGSCPTSYVCLSSGVGSGWCTFTCSTDAQCQSGYTNVGDAKCSMTVQEEDGSGNPIGSAFSACGIFCANGSAIICDPGTCNGTCPTGLTCSQDVLEEGSDTVLGSACEMN